MENKQLHTTHYEHLQEDPLASIQLNCFELSIVPMIKLSISSECLTIQRKISGWKKLAEVLTW